MVIEFLFVFLLLTGIGNSMPQPEDVPEPLTSKGIGESARYYTDYLPNLNPLSWFRERENFEKVSRTREELLFDVIDCLLNKEAHEACKKKLEIAGPLFKIKEQKDVHLTTEESTQPTEPSTTVSENTESQTENNS